jgi:hypothetical protein
MLGLVHCHSNHSHSLAYLIFIAVYGSEGGYAFPSFFKKNILYGTVMY